MGQIRPHLSADRQYQQRLVRFIENHDEPRAAAVFDDRRQRAAAVATLTQTGARLVHDGQFDGRKVRLPVFLGRYPDEPTDRELSAFYRHAAGGLEGSHFPHRHLGALRLHGMARQRHHRQSRGLVLGRRTADGSSWSTSATPTPAATYEHPGTTSEAARSPSPTRRRNAVFERTGDDLTNGLYVQLAPWSWHLLRVANPHDDVDVITNIRRTGRLLWELSGSA